MWLTEKVGALRQQQRNASMQRPWTGAPTAAQPEMPYAPPHAGARPGTHQHQDHDEVLAAIGDAEGGARR